MFGIKGHSAELFFADIHNVGVLARMGVVFGDP